MIQYMWSFLFSNRDARISWLPVQSHLNGLLKLVHMQVDRDVNPPLYPINKGIIGFLCSIEQRNPMIPLFIGFHM